MFVYNFVSLLVSRFARIVLDALVELLVKRIVESFCFWVAFAYFLTLSQFSRGQRRRVLNAHLPLILSVSLVPNAAPIKHSDNFNHNVHYNLLLTCLIFEFFRTFVPSFFFFSHESNSCGWDSVCVSVLGWSESRCLYLISQTSDNSKSSWVRDIVRERSNHTGKVYKTLVDYAFGMDTVE